MPIETTYSAARANLAKLFDRVVDDAETVVIRRKSGRDVAIVSADELERLSTSAHLLASPANRRRLLSALRNSRKGRGKPMTLNELKQRVGL